MHRFAPINRRHFLYGAGMGVAAFNILPSSLNGAESTSPNAIRTGRKAGSNFDYGAPLTQVALPGLIAIRFPGQTLKWDDKAVRFTNSDAANLCVNPAYRKGWSL